MIDLFGENRQLSPRGFAKNSNKTYRYDTSQTSLLSWRSSTLLNTLVKDVLKYLRRSIEIFDLTVYEFHCEDVEFSKVERLVIILTRQIVRSGNYDSSWSTSRTFFTTSFKTGKKSQTRLLVKRDKLLRKCLPLQDQEMAPATIKAST